MENNIKNLNVIDLKNKAKELKSKGEFYITVGGEEFKVEHDNVFVNSKIHRVLDDLILLFNEGRNRNELMEVSTPYVTLLIIKHFTSIEVSDDIDEALEVMEALIDLEVMDKIINALPEEEIVKMYEKISVVMNNVRSSLEDGELEAREIEKELQSEQVKKMVKNED